MADVAKILGNLLLDLQQEIPDEQIVFATYGVVIVDEQTVLNGGGPGAVAVGTRKLYFFAKKRFGKQILVDVDLSGVTEVDRATLRLADGDHDCLQLAFRDEHSWVFAPHHDISPDTIDSLHSAVTRVVGPAG